MIVTKENGLTKIIYKNQTYSMTIDSIFGRDELVHIIPEFGFELIVPFELVEQKYGTTTIGDYIDYLGSNSLL